MKIIKILLLIFYLVLNFNLFGNISYYNTAVEYYNKKDYKNALIYIEKAYNLEPEKDTVKYMYGVILFVNDKYIESINILKLIPIEYNTFYVQSYIVNSYRKLNNYDKVVETIMNAIPYIQNSDENKRYFYNQIFEIWKDQKKYILIKEYLKNNEKDIYTYYSDKNSEWLDWIEFLITASFLDYAITLAENDNPESLDYLKLAIHYYSKDLGKYNQNILLESVGLAYHKKKLYEKAIEALKIVPDSDNRFLRANYLADSFRKINKKEEAVNVILNVIKQEEMKPYWKYYLYSMLFEMLRDLDRETTILEIENDYFLYQKNSKHDAFPYINYILLNYFFKKFEKYGIEEDYKKVDYFYKLGFKYYETDLKDNKKNINKNEIDIIYKAFHFYKDNKFKVDKAYKHKFLVLILKELNSSWNDLNGNKKYIHNYHQDQFIMDYDMSFKISQRLIYYFTKGEIFIEYDFHKVNSVVTEISHNKWERKNEISQVYQPVLETSQPYNIGEILFKNRNNYDTICYITPSQNTPIEAIGGLIPLKYVPYIMYGVNRGMISTGSELMFTYKTIIHEFFHIVEGLYNKDYKLISHVYLDVNKNYWPSWYNGEGELIYYKYIFENVISKDNYKKLHIRDTIDNSDEKLFDKKREIFNKYKIEDLKKADEFKNQAWNYNSEKNDDKALEYFLKSYNIVKENEEVIEAIGYYYYKKEMYDIALSYYLETFSINEKGNIVAMIGFLYERVGNTNEAIKYYKISYEKFNNYNDLYLVGSLYTKVKDYDNAYYYLEEYLKKFNDKEMAIHALDVISWILINEKKDYVKTIEIVSKYFDTVKDNKLNLKKIVALHMGIALGELNRKEEAILWLEKSAQLGYPKDNYYNSIYNKYKK